MVALMAFSSSLIPRLVMVSAVEGKELQPLEVTTTVYAPLLVTVKVRLVAFGINVPFRYHWLLAELLEVSTKPACEIEGVEGVVLVVTTCAVEAGPEQPFKVAVAV